MIDTNDCIKTWKRGEIQVKLFYVGTTKLNYRLKWKGQIIFEGDDFRPSPTHCIDSIESVRSLLGFLTLQKGDVDSEYFKNYTEKQWDFVNSKEADDIRLYLYDMENK